MRGPRDQVPVHQRRTTQPPVHPFTLPSMKIISLPFDFHGWQRQHPCRIAAVVCYLVPQACPLGSLNLG